MTATDCRKDGRTDDVDRPADGHNDNDNDDDDDDDDNDDDDDEYFCPETETMKCG